MADVAHGTPDWGVTAGAVTTYQLTDLAELAARLGSIDTFDRRGDVLFLDTFESGLGLWVSTLNGTGARFDLSAVRSRYGRYSARLVAGSDGAAQASIFHDLPFPVLSAMGMEIGINLATPFDYVELAHDVYDGTNWTQFRIRYVYVGAVLQYQDSSGAFVAIATDLSPQGSAVQFNDFKLVVNPSTAEYVRLIVNSRTHLLTGVAARSVAEVTGPKRQAMIDFRGIAAENDSLYIDDVILTQNEPV